MVSAGRGNRIGKRRLVEPIEEHLPPCEIDPAVAAAEPWETTSGAEGKTGEARIAKEINTTQRTERVLVGSAGHRAGERLPPC